jgi:hypothetical protein
MSITRRQFLLGATSTATGLVVPTYLAKATQFLEETGSALIQPPDNIVTTLYAEDYEGEFRLLLGPDDAVPESMTYREYAEYAGYDSIEQFMNSWGVEAEELAEEIDYQFVVDHWVRHVHPQAMAYHFLEELDLMPEDGDPSAIGNLDFIDGYFPGSDYLGVHAPDKISLSLLQERLNQLDTGIHIILEGDEI